MRAPRAAPAARPAAAGAARRGARPAGRLVRAAVLRLRRRGGGGAGDDRRRRSLAQPRRPRPVAGGHARWRWRRCVAAPATHLVGVVAFDDRADLVVAPTVDRAAAAVAVSALTPGAGGTRYTSAHGPGRRSAGPRRRPDRRRHRRAERRLAGRDAAPTPDAVEVVGAGGGAAGRQPRRHQRAHRRRRADRGGAELRAGPARRHAARPGRRPRAGARADRARPAAPPPKSG